MAGRRMAGRRRAGRGPQFAAADAVGAPVARALWFVLWTALAWLAVLADRGPGLLPGLARPVLCPRLAASCQIMMGVAMAYMLILML